MLAAALVPDTVLLLPGTSGRRPADPGLAALRDAAARAVARAVRGADRVVVVAPGAVTRSVVGEVTLGAAAAGVPDHLLADDVPRVELRPAPGGPPPVPGAPGTGAVVGARAALDAHVPPAWLHVVEVAGPPAAGAADLRALGTDLVAHGTGPVAHRDLALVVVGSGAARHGDDAPLAADPRAAAHDRSLLAGLRAGAAGARAALAGLDPAVAAALAVTGWAPWQVLVGALGDDAATGPDVLHAAVWRGAGHLAAVWEVAS